MKTTTVAVMLTRRCNMACTHCSVESHPRLKIQPDEEKIRQRVKALLAAGVKAFQFTGGEPLLRQSLLLEMMRLVRDAGAACAVFSNGFWGKKPDVAEQTFDALREAGMTRLALSYDRFHAEFHGPEPLLNILEVARRRDWPVRVTITRTADERDLEEMVAPFRGLSHAELRFYDVQPVGAARTLSDKLRGELAGFCAACSQATVTDDGRVIACNGPSYFEKQSSPLLVGDCGDPARLEHLLQQHAEDPFLEAIRVEGPLRLKEILSELDGFEDFPFRPEYQGMCELCLHISRTPEAVTALRAHLSTPEQKAVTVARRRLREQVRTEALAGGGFNEFAGPKAVMGAMIEQPPSVWARSITRADLDWRRLAERMAEAGLLHLWRERRKDPYLSRWVPQFVWKAGDGLEHGIEQQRSLQERVVTSAREAGFTVRLAGASALLASGGRRIPSRVSLLTEQDPLALERCLAARWGRELRLEISRGRVDGDVFLATEVLQAWRGRLFRDGLGVVWDACELHRRGAWQIDGDLPPTLQVAARVLALDFAIDEPRSSGGGVAPGLLERIVRAQMFRDPRQQDNLYLASALYCLEARSPAGGLGAIARAWLGLGRQLHSLRRQRDWRRAGRRLREDFQAVKVHLFGR